MILQYPTSTLVKKEIADASALEVSRAESDVPADKTLFQPPDKTLGLGRQGGGGKVKGLSSCLPFCLATVSRSGAVPWSCRSRRQALQLRPVTAAMNVPTTFVQSGLGAHSTAMFLDDCESTKALRRWFTDTTRTIKDDSKP
jgi:hypothetical protein